MAQRVTGKEKRAKPAKIKHLKKGDIVYVLGGRDYEHRLARVSDEELQGLDQAQLRAQANKQTGKRGKVISVLPHQGKVLVDGVHMVTKHAKPRGRVGRAASLQTGRIQQPAAIAIANVMLVCPRCDHPTRVSRGVVEGKRVRLCKQCGENIDLA